MAQQYPNVPEECFEDEIPGRLDKFIHRQSSSIMKAQGKDAAILRAFDHLDLNGDGYLDRAEIGHFMLTAAKQIRLQVELKVIDDAVDALLEDVSVTSSMDPKLLQQQQQQQLQHNAFIITRDQFLNIFRRNPDMLSAFENDDDDDKTLVSTHQPVTSLQDDEDEENAQVWESARTHWKNRRVVILWLGLYAIANVAAFAYSAVKYYFDDEAMAIFGNCIVVARGSAQCLNLNAFLILLPMCRHFITRTRAFGKIRFWFPFDAIVEFHMLVGLALLLFTIAHVAAHICDFARFASAEEQDIIQLFGTKLGDTIPESKIDRWLLLLRQPAGVTGIIMVVCMAIGYATILGRRKRFNTFWVTHHLLLIMLIALCFHGMGKMLAPFQSVYWIAVPLLLYVGPRVYRATTCTTCQVLDVAIKGGNVVGLKLAKPASWNNYVKAGMYAFINVPQVSGMEWHPFTLTSAPHDDFIEFHFCRVGDWTSKVHDLLGNIEYNESKRKITETPTFDNLVVKIDGPMGASSQGFSDYPILILVAAGIGVTPMISVLKQLLKEPGKMKHTYLYWTVRDRASFEWFWTLMDEIYERDQKQVLRVRHFLTSVKEDTRDLGAILLHHATRAKHKRTDFDFLLGRRVHHQVEIGRPDWDEEFSAIRQEAKALGYRKGNIFLCGPQIMAQEIDRARFHVSAVDPGFHFHFRKETF